MELLIKFQNMDRRWIFLGMAVAIVLPLLLPMKIPFRTDKEVRDIYRSIETLPKGTPILISADFDPASVPELGPFYETHLHHLFQRELRPVVLTLWPTAIPLVLPKLQQIAKSYGAKYGQDFVFLGYKEGRELVIKNIGQNIYQQFPTDYFGTPIKEIPIMDARRQAKDFPLLVSISAGFPGLNEYVLQIQGQYDLAMLGACTAVGGPDYIPFYKSGQLKGLSMGMPGSAQYEQLVWKGEPKPGLKLMATSAMDVLNLGHVFIVLLIIMGNLAYFITRRIEES